MSRGPGRQHDASKRALAQAACEVIATDSIQALTVRRVAAAANASVGRVQHYFADRSEIVHEAFLVTQQDAASEVEASLRGSTSPIDIVRAVLSAMIPVNGTQMRRMRIMAQFEALALSDEEFASTLREGHLRLRQLLADALSAASPESARVAADDAQRLLALAEGLAGEVLLGQEASERALRLVQDAVDEITDRRAT